MANRPTRPPPQPSWPPSPRPPRRRRCRPSAPPHSAAGLPLLALVAGHDAHQRDLLARARVRVDDVGAWRAAEPGRLGLADEDARALRAVSLLDPDLLTFAESVHDRMVAPHTTGRHHPVRMIGRGPQPPDASGRHELLAAVDV